MRWLAAVMLAACSTADGPAPARAPMAAPPSSAATGGAVVVELYTSQGCSSCPPAERVLSELARDRPDVIALAFHVDYWNRLGWADPWSQPAWSARQEAYARDHDARIYTPALVIDGADDVVGSQRAAVEAAIARAPRLPPIVGAATVVGDRLRVTATLPSGSHGAVAIIEDALITAVAAGENAGVTMTNDRVVRALVPLAGAAEVPLDADWQRGALEAVVLAADGDGRLIAAARLPIAP